jgi:hypothetical protein
MMSEIGIVSSKNTGSILAPLLGREPAFCDSGARMEPESEMLAPGKFPNQICDLHSFHHSMASVRRREASLRQFQAVVFKEKSNDSP